MPGAHRDPQADSDKKPERGEDSPSTGNTDRSQGLSIHWSARPPPSASGREREIGHVQRAFHPTGR